MKKSSELITKEQELKQVNATLLKLNNMLEKAKIDLGDITRDDVISLYNQGVLSAQQRDENINSIDVLESIIAQTPEIIENTEQLRDRLLDEISKMRTIQ